MWQRGGCLLDKRKISLIKVFIKENKFVTIDNLSKTFKVSNRTIRYDLDSIDHWLKMNNFIPLIRKPRKGIYLDIYKIDFERLKELLDQNDYINYVLSPDERIKIILLTLLNNSSKVYIKSLADKLVVSKSTIVNDVNAGEKILEKYYLTLSRENSYIQIIGSESNRRRLISYLLKNYKDDKSNLVLNDTMNYYIKTMKTWFPEIDLEYIRNQIEIIQDFMKVEFSFESLSNLITHIALAIERLKVGKDIKIDSNQLKIIKTKEEFVWAKKISINLSEKFGVVIPDDEIAYITYHLMGARLNEVENYEDYSEKNNNILNLIELIVEQVQLEMNVLILDTISLKKDIFLHMVPAIQRIKFNNYFENPLLESIKCEYEELFNACGEALKIIEDKFRINFDENEISYITMHFAAALHLQQKNLVSCPKILLVCASGLGTSRLLKARLQYYFEDFEVVDVISYQHLDEYLSNPFIDLIISTIPIKSESIPVIEVSLLLGKEEIEVLSQYLKYKGNLKPLHNTNEMMISDILSIVESNCEVKNKTELESQIRNYFNNSKLFMNSKKSNVNNEIISPENIKVNVLCNSWKEAVLKASQVLIDKDYISKLYLDNILRDYESNSAALVIAPSIAMPHTKGDKGVFKTGISILILEKPVSFNHSKFDPIDIIVFLAAKDKNSHVEDLVKIIDFMCDKDNLKRIKEAKTSNDIYNLIFEGR